MDSVKIASLLLVLPLAGCGVVDVVSKVSVDDDPPVVGTGKAVRETRKAQAATGVEASGAMEVQIRRGTPKLVVEAQREVLKRLRTEYKDGRLVMWIEGSVNTDRPVRAWYAGPNVSSVEGSGATVIDATGLSGSKSEIVLSGASKLKGVGRVTRLELKVSGASEASLKALEAETVRVEASGASKVWVTAKKSINASASGASEVRYFGNPSSRTDETSGVSSVGPG